jgi:hypothetical protein
MEGMHRSLAKQDALVANIISDVLHVNEIPRSCCKWQIQKTARYRRLIVFPIRDIASSLKLEAGENTSKTAQAQYSLQVKAILRN